MNYNPPYDRHRSLLLNLLPSSFSLALGGGVIVKCFLQNKISFVLPKECFGIWAVESPVYTVFCTDSIALLWMQTAEN